MLDFIEPVDRVLWTPWSVNDVLSEIRRTSGMLDPRRALPENRAEITSVNRKDRSFKIRFTGEGFLGSPLETLVTKAHVRRDPRGARIYVRVTPSWRGLILVPLVQGAVTFTELVVLLTVAGASELSQFASRGSSWFAGSLQIAGIVAFRAIRLIRAQVEKGHAIAYIKERLSAEEIPMVEEPANRLRSTWIAIEDTHRSLKRSAWPTVGRGAVHLPRAWNATYPS